MLPLAPDRTPARAAVSTVLLLLALAAPAHAQWVTNGVALTTVTGQQTGPILASPDGAGGAYFVWLDPRNGNTDLYGMHVTSSGARAVGWPVDGLALCTDATVPKDPAIASDGNGGAYLVWSDARGGPLDVFALRLVSGGIAPGWPANGLLVCGATNDQETPVVVSDGGTGALVAWGDIRGTHEDIYAQHVLANATLDAGWTPGGNLVCGAAQQQSYPTMVADGAGGAVLAWVDGRNGGVLFPEKDIYAVRITGAGGLATGWTADGTALVIVTGKDQDKPKAVSDGAGGAIVVWLDLRNDSPSVQTDLYAMRIRGDGTLAPGWTADGTAVILAAGEQVGPVLVSDGANGAIFAWQDGRDSSVFPTNDDVYATRLLANGTRAGGWPASGTLLCNEASLSKQREATMVPDGNGGALVAWRDSRPGGEIYAQHVKGDGTRFAGWPADGIAICTATNEQLSPSLVSDGAGGGVCAWEDERNGFSNHDIYAQRFLGSGQVGPTVGVTRAPAGGLSIAFAGAHPARGAARFSVTIPEAAETRATVYNPAGRVVSVLWDGGVRDAGPHTLTWAGRDADGHASPPGMYYLRVVAPTGEASLRFVFLP